MYFHSGQSVLHSDHSVPNSWDVIKNWLDPSVPEVNIPPPPEPSFSIKCPEIAELPYYDRTPPPYFWNNLSKNHEKSSPSTNVNIDEFSNFISHCKNKWSARQKIIAFSSLKTLKFGNKTIFNKKKIPSFHSPNANSAVRHSKCITDTVTTWIKKEFVIGFSTTLLSKISILVP